jgi:hypothetical protein
MSVADVTSPDIPVLIEPLMYNDLLDTTNIQNILLINSAIYESQLFYDSANTNTFPIIYSYSSEKTELLTLFRNKFQNGIKRITLAFHDPFNSAGTFLDNTSFFEENDLLENQTTFSDNITFLSNLVTEFNVENYDFLACNTLQYSNWQNYYEVLSKITHVTCGASNDNTGNIQYGADWVMENTNENIKYIYFSDSINEYSSYLAAPNITGVYILNNDYKKIYIAGTNFPSSFVLYFNTLNLLFPSFTKTNTSSLITVTLSSSNYIISKVQVAYGFWNLSTSNSYSVSPNLVSTSDSLTISKIYILENNYKEIYIEGQNFSNINLNSDVKFNGAVIYPTIGVVSRVSVLGIVVPTLLKVTMNSSTYNINSVSLKDMYNNTIISKSITPSFISNSDSLLINSVYILDNNYKTIYIAGNNFSNVNVNSGVKFNNVVISPTVGTVSFVNNLLLRVDMVSSNYNISLVSVTDIYNRSILISEIIKVLLPSLKSTADSLAITSVNITNNLYKYIYINGQNFSDVTSVKFNDGNILPASFVVMSSILIKATMSSSTYNVYNTSVKDSFNNNYITYSLTVGSVPTNLISASDTLVVNGIYTSGSFYGDIFISGQNLSNITTENVKFTSEGSQVSPVLVTVKSNILLQATMPSSQDYNISSISVKDSFDNTVITKSINPHLISYFPKITSVANTTPNNYAEISITGTNFVIGDTVSFNGSGISQSSVTVFSSTLIKVAIMSGINYNISSVMVTDTNGNSSTPFSLQTSLQSYFPSTISNVYIYNHNKQYIFIRGYNFINGNTVSFGGSSVPDPLSYSVSFIRSTLLKVTINSEYDITNVTVMVKDKYDTPSNSYSLITDLISNICFIAETPITTDQGNIPIEQIEPSIHTIRNKKIVAITKTVTQDKYLVCFEKDSLGKNIPSQQTIISKNHKLFYNGKMRNAKEFLKDFANVVKVKYTGSSLYNVLLEEHDKMMVNNLICETLDPENGVAKVYMALQKLDTEEEQQSLIRKINAHVIKNNVFNSNKKAIK